MKTFKTVFAALLIAALSFLTTATLHADPPTYTLYSATSTNGASTLSTAIIGANSANAGTPVVTCIDAVSDKAASKVQFYKTTSETAANYTNSTVTLPVAGGGINSGTILIRHLLTDSYEKRTLTTSTAATNLVVTAAPLDAVVPGDVIYFVTTSGAAAMTLKTNSFAGGVLGMTLQMSGNGLVTGQKGKPLMAEVDGTASATLHNLTARIDP